MAASNAKQTHSESESDREMVFTRIFDAPRELVWKSWTDPELVGKWWGPNGFTVTTHSIEVKEGGVWRFVMHGPDGRDYENRLTYDEIKKPELLRYHHGGEGHAEPGQHHSTVTFEDMGGKTKLTMRMVFASAQERDYIIKKYKADIGGRQHLENLAEHLKNQGAETPVFTIARTFDAPRDLVWRAWTEPKLMALWWGPKGMGVGKYTMDFRPGGTYLYSLKTPDGKLMWGKFTYRDIVAPEKLVFVNCFSDEQGGITRHPMSPSWPLELLSTITFAEQNGKTTVTVHWTPINATPEELKTFADGKGSMQQGWGGTLDQLGTFLKSQ